MSQTQRNSLTDKITNVFMDKQDQIFYKIIGTTKKNENLKPENDACLLQTELMNLSIGIMNLSLSFA